MLKKIKVFLLVILVMTMMAMGASIAFADDNSSAQQTRVVSIVNSQLTKRLLSLKDKATLDTALSRLVANGTLTDQQAARIKARAALSESNSMLSYRSIVKRLLALKDEATLDTALSRLVTNGTLTDQQAAGIKARYALSES